MNPRFCCNGLCACVRGHEHARTPALNQHGGKGHMTVKQWASSAMLRCLCFSSTSLGRSSDQWCLGVPPQADKSRNHGYHSYRWICPSAPRLKHFQHNGPHFTEKSPTEAGFCSRAGGKLKLKFWANCTYSAVKTTRDADAAAAHGGSQKLGCAVITRTTRGWFQGRLAGIYSRNTSGQHGAQRSLITLDLVEPRIPN